MSSSRLCDSCKSASATLFCRADAAFLCGECDGKIHTANKLASRHERVWLCEVCEVCEQAPAHVTCKADAAALCVTCDRDIHSANPLSRRHERVPVSPFYDAVPGGGSAKSASSVNFIDEDADVSMEAASWLLPNPSIKYGGGGVEIPNLFSDLEYSAVDPKMEALENSSGNDGVVPVQNKLFLNEDYFNFDISASKTFPHGFNCINNQTVSSASLDVALVPEGGVMTDISNTTTTPAVQLSPAEREARVLRYREKRKNRKFEKTIRYASRKAYAEMRPRIKGRFAKRTDSRGNDGGDVGVYGGFGVVSSF